MNRALRITLFLTAIVLLCACSRKEDGVILVADDDPDMALAIAKARETLPRFWEAFEKPGPGESDFALKVKIADAKDVEHFWLTGLERVNGKVFGTIENDPEIVHNVKLGDRIEIPEADITDWLYMRNEKMVGNQTLRVLFKQMSDSEVEFYKTKLAEP